MTTATVPLLPIRTATRPRPAKPRTRSILKLLWAILQVAFGWFPLTMRGAILLAGLASAGWYIGVERRDVVLLSAGLVAVGWMAGALILVLLSGLWLQVRRQRVPGEPLELEADVPCPTGYSPGWLALLPVLNVEIVWRNPMGVEAVTRLRGFRVVEEVIARRRGEFSEVRRHIRVSDLFGLVRVIVRRRWDCNVVVRPSAGEVGNVPTPRSFREGEGDPCPEGGPHGDRVDQRRYNPGDPLKVVLWKAYARSGRMLVRTPERALAEVDRIRVYFVPSDDAGPVPSDEPTAGVARAALESGTLGRDFTFAADGDDCPADTVEHALKRIVSSGSAHGRGGEGLDRFLAAEQETAGALLFLPARPGQWLGRVERTVRTRPGLFRAVIGVDGSPAKPAPSGWVRLFLQRTRAVTTNEVQETYRRLVAIGVEVLVIDRTTGRTLEILN